MWVYHVASLCVEHQRRILPQQAAWSGSEERRGTVPIQTAPSSGCWEGWVHAARTAVKNPSLLGSCSPHPTAPPERCRTWAWCSRTAGAEAHCSKRWPQKRHTQQSPPGPWCRGCACLALPWMRRIKPVKDGAAKLDDKTTRCVLLFSPVLISKSKNTFIIEHHRLQLVKQSMTAERNPSTPLVHFQVLVFVSSAVAPQHLFLSALLYVSDLSRLNCSDLILHKRRTDPKSSDVVFCIPHFAWRSVRKCFIKCNLAELPWRVCIAVQFYFRQCGCCIEVFPPLRLAHFFHVPATKLWTGWKYVI